MRTRAAILTSQPTPEATSSRFVYLHTAKGFYAESQGFDNYLKPPTANVNKKKVEATEADRLFSNSSATYQQVSAAFAMCDGVLIPVTWISPRPPLME